MSRSSPADGSVTLLPEEAAIIIGCMDTLSMLMQPDHVWTPGERAIYEEALILLGQPGSRTDDNGNDGWENLLH